MNNIFDIIEWALSSKKNLIKSIIIAYLIICVIAFMAPSDTSRVQYWNIIYWMFYLMAL